MVSKKTFLLRINQNIWKELEAWAADELRKTEGRYRALFEDNPVETIVVDNDGRITMYNKASEAPNPAYRYAVDVVREQNVTFNLRLIFEAASWRGAPMLADGDVTTNPAAKKPKNAKTALGNLIVKLTKKAITTDVDFTKDGMI